MSLFAGTKPVLVVDVDALMKSRGVRGRPAPRQQVQVLRAFSRMAQREGFGLTAVMSGKELEKAAHNRVVDQVRARYAPTSKEMPAELIKALKQAGTRGILVTDDAEMEKKAVQRGAVVLRLSTFRKLLDDMGDSGGSSSGGGRSDGSAEKGAKGGAQTAGQGGGRRSSRRRRKKPQSQPQQTQSESNGQDEGEEDAIRRMIDLVD